MIDDLPRIVGMLVLLAFVITILALIVTQWNNKDFRDFVVNHFAAIIGLPTAGIFAFLIVAVFQSTAGQIVFETFGLKFHGAAGPIIFWVISFLAITGSIRMLWNQK